MRTYGLALLAGMFATVACAGGGTSSIPPQDAPPPGQPVAIETILQQSLPGQTGDTLRQVVRDQVAWTEFWSAFREGSSLSAEPPAVDFTKDMVMVAAMRTQPCVSKVTIRGVVLQEVPGAEEGQGEQGEERAQELVVDLLEAPPAPNCVCITSERPVHIVRLPKSDAAPRFVVERGQTSC